MFTGIVQDLVRVGSVVDQGDLVQIEVILGGLADRLALGASVAVNGTCLTVTHVADTAARFDVIKETLRTTNLGRINAGDQVNVERSFQVGDEVGGHIVSGHVSCTGALVEKREFGNDYVLRFSIDSRWMKFVFHKGFIALDGASLTVSAVDREASEFEVSLIPETLSRTTLGFCAHGSAVNVEVDSQTVTTVETVERLFADPNWVKQIGALS